MKSMETIQEGHDIRITQFSGVIVSALVFLVYGLSLSGHYTGGSIEFASEIETSLLRVMMQQHKLLIHPIAWLFLQLWKVAGWQGLGILPLQIFNALAGAVCAGAVFSVAQRLVRNMPLALIVTAGFAFSCGVWLFSTEAEFVTPPLAESLAILAVLLTIRQADVLLPKSACLLGIATGFAALTYSLNILLVAPVLAAILLVKVQPMQARLRQGVRYLATAFVSIVPVYATVFYFVYGIHSLDGLRGLSVYGGQGQGLLYGTFSPSNLFYGSYALLRSLIGFPGIGLDDQTSVYLSSVGLGQKIIFVIFYLCVFLAFAFPLWRIFRRRHSIGNEDWIRIAILGVWALPNIVFAYYWVPKDMQFWIPVLIAWWLLVVVQLKVIRTESWTLPGFARKLRLNQVTIQGGLAALVLLGGGINAVGLVFPHHQLSTNEAFWAAEKISQLTTPKDLIVTTGTDDMYITYFSHRSTFDMISKSFSVGQNKPLLIQEVNQAIAEAKTRGGSAYLVVWPEAQNPSSPPDDVLEMTRSDLLQIGPCQWIQIQGATVNFINPQ
jgi:hypothetical protein